VASAKEWNDKKKVKVLLTLLCGKLMDIYITLDEDKKADLTEVKNVLIGKVGLIRDPLFSEKEFMVWPQVHLNTNQESLMEMQILCQGFLQL